eukprot:scaffold17406_cov116-Isochrysis_galbana.AAC.4
MLADAPAQLLAALPVAHTSSSDSKSSSYSSAPLAGVARLAPLNCRKVESRRVSSSGVESDGASPDHTPSSSRSCVPSPPPVPPPSRCMRGARTPPAKHSFHSSSERFTDSAGCSGSPTAAAGPAKPAGASTVDLGQ